VKVSIHTHDNIFEALRDEWNALVFRSTANTIFCTHEWQSTWWRTYQSNNTPWIVLCRTEDDKLVGIGSWFVHLVDGERVLRTIGCVDVTDYVDIIADIDYVHEVQVALANVLLEHHNHFDRINFCNIPEISPSCSGFTNQLKSCGFDVELAFQEVCPVINLPSTWEAYLESLDKKQRHEIRRKIRRAESEADIEYVLINETHNIDEAATNFLTLMRSSHPEKAQFLDNPQNAEFIRRIIRITFEKGWLKLRFLKVDGTLAATYCDFDYDGRIMVYNSGLSPEVQPHLSLGIVLLSYNIRAAIETNHAIFDFLRGNETYKYRMGAQDTKIFKLKAHLPQ
jgi:CelD/BcsL family acetyltransferase involved in cellulose biosynthesis